MTQLLTLLLTTVLTHTHAGVLPDSRQEGQANAFFSALGAAPVTCPDSLAGTDSSFFCATTEQAAPAFRSVIDATAADLRPVGPWASYTNQNDQQRSYLFRDGFMTVTYFPARGDDLVVVQYAMPHD